MYANRTQIGTDGANTLDDRLPPQNLEAERHTLSACLLNSEALDEAILVLSPDDFYREAHGVVFRTLKELRDAGRTTDAVILADELIRRGQYKQLGGDDFLAEIANAAPHAANVRYHADIVRQKAVTRNLIQAASETIRDGYSNLFTSQQLVESAESKVFAIRDAVCSSEVFGADRFVGEAMTTIAGRRDGGDEGVPTGFTDLDMMIVGAKPEELVIVAARPSMGKTAFAMQVAVDAASGSDKRRPVPVLVVSLETGRHALGERMLSTHAQINSQSLRRPWLMPYVEANRLANSAAALSQIPIVIDDSPSRTVGQIAANGRRMKHRGGLGLIVIDYMQLLDGEKQRGEGRHEEIAKISRRLKAMARELGVPVIALSQLNRAVEGRSGDDRRPRLSDLRESGQIEQDADTVILLHRPEYYDPADQPGVAEAIVAKNRNGPTGTARLCFRKNCTRFDSLAFGERPIPDEMPIETPY